MMKPKNRRYSWEYRGEHDFLTKYTPNQLRKLKRWAGEHRKGESENFVVNKRGNLEVNVLGMPVEIRKFNPVADRAIMGEFAATKASKTIPEDVLPKLSHGKADGIIGVIEIGGKKRIVGLYGYAAEKDKKLLHPGYLFVDQRFRGEMLGTFLTAARDAKYPGYRAYAQRETPTAWKIFETLGYEDRYFTEKRGLENHAAKNLDADKGGKKIKRKV